MHTVLQSLFGQVPELRKAPAHCYSITRKALPYRSGNLALGSILPTHHGSATAFSACVIKANPLFIRRDNGVEKSTRLGAPKQNSRVSNACHFVVIGELMWDSSTALIRFANCVQMDFSGCMGTVKCFRRLPYRLRWIRLDY